MNQKLQPPVDKSLLNFYQDWYNLNMLMEFYGRECGHCKKMDPLIDKLEQELGIKVQRMEVWHDEQNEKKWADEARGICMGVPFFVNTDTQKTICGEATYDELKSWATSN